MPKSEDQNIEFKESWRDDVLKTVCAFANTEGGIVYIGINDKGKSVEVKNTKKLLEDIPNKIKDMLGIVADIKSSKKDKHTIIKITINKYKAPISYKGKFYMRSGSTTSALSDHSLSRFLLSSSGTTWESVVEPNSSIKDIKVKTVRYFQDLAKKGIAVLSAGKRTLQEEIPEAYKDVEDVVNVVTGAGLSQKVARLTPLGVIKG